MKYPLDTSDEASLIQADWHEEFGDIGVANQIREEVTDPKGNDWYYEFNIAVGVGAVGGGVGIGVGVGVVVGGGIGVGVVVGGGVGVGVGVVGGVGVGFGGGVGS